MSVEAPFRTQLDVTGMSCPHCVLAVTEEVAGIDGVSAIDVQLETGTVTVLADRDVRRDEIAAAVTDLGFGLAE